MKLFIDTANLDEIRQASELGVLDGVTTNPTLMAREHADMKVRLKEICQIVHGPVSAEVLATTTDAMVREAEQYLPIAQNIVIKLPCTHDGVRALKKLADRGVKVNMTLCFQPLQALVVAKAGASFVSPFVGRFDDEAEDGMNLIREIRTIYNNYHFKTQILAASIRSPFHLTQAAILGADIATVPFAVLKQTLHHPLTDLGLERFLADWRKTNQKI